jgi:hypothetical protein
MAPSHRATRSHTLSGRVTFAGYRGAFISPARPSRTVDRVRHRRTSSRDETPVPRRRRGRRFRTRRTWRDRAHGRAGHRSVIARPHRAGTPRTRTGRVHRRTRCVRSRRLSEGVPLPVDVDVYVEATFRESFVDGTLDGRCGRALEASVKPPVRVAKPDPRSRGSPPAVAGARTTGRACRRAVPAVGRANSSRWTRRRKPPQWARTASQRFPAERFRGSGRPAGR